ncbi:MAG: UDP-glucose 4-epimerase GalE [Rickettsiales bacterium]|jgi:UDP-glucose 4-epimerase|nr:UDP-glucose 4-epimerase GalE [Rickettsiales bacterium]
MTKTLETIMVTGGIGYIGSHTVVALQESGFNVVIVDNLSNAAITVLDGIESITGVRPAFELVDCTDLSAMRNVFIKHKNINGIIHFAALKAVGESIQQPIKYYRNNIGSLLNILEMMSEFNVPNIVFSSSATVYGDPDVSTVTEQTPLKAAMSPYGNTKVIGESIIRDTAHANQNIHAILLRYFNPIGAHPSAKIGELPSGVPNNLLPYITQTAAGIRERLSVFGNDYDTPDGFCVRDYIDVNDLAAAHVVAIKRMIDKQQKEQTEVFNLGTGKGVSVMELILAFERATGIKLNYTIADRRPGDIAAIWADVSLANNELGWKSVKTLDETLLSSWLWQKNTSGIA